MDKNELLGAVAEYGLDGVADRLELSEDFIERCIAGNDPDRREQAILDRAFADYEITELERGDTSEIDRIGELGNAIDRIEYFAGEGNWESIREGIASGLIDPEGFEIYENLAANLTDSQLERVMEHVATEGGAILETIFSDYDFQDDYFFEDDSAFWEWFRETFYE